MIHQNELRIGNYYQNDCEHYLSEFDNKIECLSAIIKDDKWRSGYCLESENGDKLDIGQANPIPLTEKILLKCGFSRSKIVSTTFILDIKTYVSSSPIRLFFYLDNEGLDFPMRIIQGGNRRGNMINAKYLHQLQNLYFALTGKELKINL